MYVVLLGAPGAGKGTQAPILAEAVSGVHLSTGDMFRQAVRDGTTYGRQAEGYMVKGLLVPDDIVLGMVMERLAKADAQHAFVLDGFPRTVVQAQELDKRLEAAGKQLDVAILFDAPHRVLAQRLGGRWTCANCQAIYHEAYSPPTQAGICDRCGGELRQRPDDRPEAVERRLKVYLDETAPLTEYYRSRGILHELDANQPPKAVTRAALGLLK
jgi:adenylate kinase